VKISTDSRFTPASARPRTASAAVPAYTSAVSKVVMPASSAARTHAVAASSSTWLPWVSQLPYETSLTDRPLRPRRRNSIRRTYLRVAPTPGRGSRHRRGRIERWNA